MNVYFDPSTGKIVGHDTSLVASCWAGVEALECSDTPDHKRQKVDLATRTVVAMTPDEVLAADAPEEVETLHARRAELAAFDWTDAAPHLSDETRAGWQAYRQALRDITLAGNSVAMVRAWPLRPDGTDAVARLRARCP